MFNCNITFTHKSIPSIKYAYKTTIVTLALGSQPRQEGLQGCKVASQEDARESHHILSGV
jgi:hypothetical protein